MFCLTNVNKYSLNVKCYCIILCDESHRDLFDFILILRYLSKQPIFTVNLLVMLHLFFFIVYDNLFSVMQLYFYCY